MRIRLTSFVIATLVQKKMVFLQGSCKNFHWILWKNLARCFLKMRYLQDPCLQCISCKDFARILQGINFLTRSCKEASLAFPWKFIQGLHFLVRFLQGKEILARFFKECIKCKDLARSLQRLHTF